MPLLNFPTPGPVVINGVTYTTSGANSIKSFWCTDEDLAHGVGSFEITIADKDGSVAAVLPAWPSEVGLWKQVSITADGNTIFKGLTENIKFQVGAGGNEVVVSGYNLGSELVNMFITKDYSVGSPTAMVGPRADLFLKDVLTKAGRTMAFITPASPVVTGGTAPSYPNAGQSPGYIQQKYIHDIIREVLTTIGWAGNVDTVGNLNMFNPLYPANTGIVLPSSVIQSVFPTDTQAYTNQQKDNNIKEGNTIRDLHVTKNYLEVKGAGAGYDPQWNGLTNNPANWVGAGISWASDSVDVPSNLAGVQPSMAGTNPPTTIGAPEYDFNPTTYGVKNDVDQTNDYLNFIFNKKTGLHYWVKQDNVITANHSSVLYNVTFTDTGSNTATLASSTPIGDSVWQETTIPTPMAFYNAWAAGQTDPYVYAGAFNFSAITKMVFNFTPPPGAFQKHITDVKFNNMYFVCQPFYVPAALNNSNGFAPVTVDRTYGQRDQVHNAGSQYVNQLDLQAYADTTATGTSLISTYKLPMLRNALTIVTDGSVLHLENKAGYSVQIENPRWAYQAPSLHGTGGKAQYWRILTTRWEYSAKGGYQQKIDVMPSSLL